jgi:hypothetical protein
MRRLKAQRADGPGGGAGGSRGVVGSRNAAAVLTVGELERFAAPGARWRNAWAGGAERQVERLRSASKELRRRLKALRNKLKPRGDLDARFG